MRLKKGMRFCPQCGTAVPKHGKTAGAILLAICLLAVLTGGIVYWCGTAPSRAAENTGEIPIPNPEAGMPEPVTEASAVVVYSGECGETITWTLDSAGTLVISGTGEMYDYYEGEGPPWINQDIPVSNVVFQGDITRIGDRAFGMTSLTNVFIPASVTGIGYQAFGFIDTLEGIWVDPENPACCSDDSGVLFDKNKQYLITAPPVLTGTYTVPEGVEWIFDAAFLKCQKLTKVDLPMSMKTIGQGAFSQCTGLTEITIPQGVESISWSTFFNCSSLKTVRIPESVTTIESGAFQDCHLDFVFYGGTWEQWEQMMRNYEDYDSDPFAGAVTRFQTY